MLQKLKEQMLSLRGSMVRAVVFALAWAIFPFWLFLPIALYLFFVPFSQIKSVIVPFLVLVLIAWAHPAGFLMAAILGLIFWYILLIKEFYIVDRRSAYEILVVALVYFLFEAFYSAEGGGFGTGAVLVALLAAIGTGALFSSFVNNFREDPPRNSRLRGQVVTLTVSFLVFELLLTGLFLPLDFVYQSSVVFVLTTLLMELSSKYLFLGNLPRRRLLVVSSTAFALLVLVLGSARWEL
ncbi:MAG: hypothetical protein P4L67_01500 [Candidatus Pacebacteria bacterium]|nr:hypothetical protein [Candidatus Paceibacterota bacterium]